MTLLRLLHRLNSDDELLRTVAKFFVDRFEVESLANRLLRDILPHSGKFVRSRKTADTPWSEVALDVLQEW